MSKFRFKIASLLMFIAVAAVFFAATASFIAGNHILLVYISYITVTAGVGVFLYNIRLSRWIWVASIGYAGPTFSELIAAYTFRMYPFSIPVGVYLTVQFVLNTILPALFVVGIAQAFRDVQRTLASRQQAQCEPVLHAPRRN